MNFKSSFKAVFQGLVFLTVLSGCGKKGFEAKTGDVISKNLNQFLSLSQAERSSIINQIGYDCGYTTQPTPVAGTSIIGATSLSSAEGGSAGGHNWIEPRRCLPVCRIIPMNEGGVVYGSTPAQTNIQISIASLDGAVAQEELSHYYIGYCKPPGGCTKVAGPGTVSGSAGGTATTVDAGLSCVPPLLPPVIEPFGPIITMPYPVPAIPVTK